MNIIVNKLESMISHYNLFQEDKWFIWYYVFLGKRKKLLFYINHRKGRVVFGVSHWGTEILKEYPMLKISADEVKTSVIKWNIHRVEDIDKKWISKIIDLCVGWYEK
jgi:hypothetical protein